MVSVGGIPVDFSISDSVFPSTVLTPDLFTEFSYIAKESMRSFGSVGLKLLGVVVSVTLIGIIFRILFLNKFDDLVAVSNRNHHRKIKMMDFHRNIDSIVEDRVSDMEVGVMAKARFRLRHPNAEVEEAVHRREVSAQADLEFHTRNPLYYPAKRDTYRRMNEDYVSARENGTSFAYIPRSESSDVK